MGGSQVLAGNDLQRHMDAVTQRIKLRRCLQFYQQVHQRRGDQPGLGVHHYANQPLLERLLRQLRGLRQDTAQARASGLLGQGADDAVTTAADLAQAA